MTPRTSDPKATAWTEEERAEMAEQRERDNVDAFERNAHGQPIRVNLRPAEAKVQAEKRDPWKGNIDHSLFTVESLLHVFLDDTFGNVDAWRKFAHIEKKKGLYGRPLVEREGWVIRYGRSFLRYSVGPGGNLVWDLYGDDFLSPALAFRRLLDAPVPPSICRPWPPNPDAHEEDGEE